jgi:hypothetical protein
MSETSEPTAADRASSDACTRSGAFALLLSVVLLSLIPYWLERPKRIALGDYLIDRLNLAISLEKLDDDPVWRRYEDSHAAAESTSIANLNKESFEIPSGTAIPGAKPSQDTPTGGSHVPPGPISRKPGPAAAMGVSPPKKAESRSATVPGPVSLLGRIPPVSKSPPPRIPAAPINISVTVNGDTTTVNELSQIAKLLTKLNDSEMLSRSVQVSNFFNQSVVRWVNKRSMLVYRNAVLNSCATKELEAPHRGNQSRFFISALDNDVLLNCSTLADIRELARFEFPAAVFNPPQFGETFGAQVDISPGALPRNLYYASILTQVLLFFVIMYFSAFAREAASLSTTVFPSRATLFGAFSRSRSTLAVFLVALWSPLLASLAAAVTSRQWPMFLCSLFIFYAVLSANRVLQQKSYWALLINGQKVAAVQPDNL